MQDTPTNEQPPENVRPPRSKVRLTFIIALWLVIVLLLIAIFSPVRDVVINRFLTGVPTPTPTLVAGDNLFYIQATPKGTISIDGRTLTNVPDPNSGQRPLQLAYGKHNIVWQVAPFSPISCVVSIPSSITNQCSDESITQSPNGSNVRLITFNASLNNLPSAPRNALIHTLQDTLNTLQSTSIVQPGEHYLLASSSGLNVTTTATQLLKATLHFNLDTNQVANRPCISYGEDVCSYNGQNCLQFCTIQVQKFPGIAPDMQPPTDGWTALALFYPTWTYTTASGQIIAQNQPDTSSSSIGTDHSIELHLTWDSKGWHASLLSTGAGSFLGGIPTIADPICTPLNDLVSSLIAYVDPSAAPGVSIHWGLLAGPNHADGCLGVAASTNTSNATLAQSALFLYRCGILIAVNPLAHHYFPSLPVANAYEQGIAQSIAARYPSLA